MSGMALNHAQDETFDRTVLVVALGILGGGMSFLLVMACLLFPEWMSPFALAPGARRVAASGRFVVLRPPTRLLEEGVATASMPVSPAYFVAAATPVAAAAPVVATPLGGGISPAPIPAETNAVEETEPTAAVDDLPAVLFIESGPGGNALGDREPTSEGQVESPPTCSGSSCPPPAGTAPVGNAPPGNAPTGNAPPGNAPTGNAPPGNSPPAGGVSGHGSGHVPVGRAPEGNAPRAETPSPGPGRGKA